MYIYTSISLYIPIYLYDRGPPTRPACLTRERVPSGKRYPPAKIFVYLKPPI